MTRDHHAIAAALADPRSTHYEVLGVPPGGVDEPGALTAARRAVALEYHPDRSSDGRAHDYTARANVAYNVLSDPRSRALYDAQLRSTHAACPVCAGAGFKRVQRGFSGHKILSCLGCAGAGWVRK